MTALGGKADIRLTGGECPLLTQSGHSQTARSVKNRQHDFSHHSPKRPEIATLLIRSQNPIASKVPVWLNG